tara:strand:+ start:2586 stop:3632 length:1047 start_codon:yes stop_codon:yes gene_type:complete
MNARYHFCPQMKIYDTMGYKWVQNLMFMNNPNFRSDVCNTDSFGLRFNSKFEFNLNETIFDQKTDKEKSVMIGSSTTFGVGSTSDNKTIPSLLSNNSKYFFYNLGGRAFNGLQEIILFQLFAEKLKNLKKIVLYSGMNDIYMSYNESFISQFPGPFYYNKDFLNKMNKTNLSFKRKILKFFLPNLKIDYGSINIQELKNYFFKKNQKKSYEGKIRFPKITIDEIANRNIYLWSLISKSLNVEVIFFLPPFLNWSKKKMDYCNEEKEIEKYIINSGNVKSNEYFEKISSHYEEIKILYKNCCEKNKIKFYDCNEIFRTKENNKKWLFVDKTHLTDYGNKIVSDFIKSKI